MAAKTLTGYIMISAVKTGQFQRDPKGAGGPKIVVVAGNFGKKIDPNSSLKFVAGNKGRDLTVRLQDPPAQIRLMATSKEVLNVGFYISKNATPTSRANLVMVLVNATVSNAAPVSVHAPRKTHGILSDVTFAYQSLDFTHDGSLTPSDDWEESF